MNLDRKMLWNGNEIVFEDSPNTGVAGISHDMPDELAEELVRRWNLVGDFIAQCDGEVKG